MPILCITEYASAGNDVLAQPIPASQVPANAKQGITIQSAPFSPGTRMILVNSDTTCWIDIGPADMNNKQGPIAQVGLDRLPQFVDRYYMVHPDQLIAVLAS